MRMKTKEVMAVGNQSVLLGRDTLRQVGRGTREPGTVSLYQVDVYGESRAPQMLRHPVLRSGLVPCGCHTLQALQLVTSLLNSRYFLSVVSWRHFSESRIRFRLTCRQRRLHMTRKENKRRKIWHLLSSHPDVLRSDHTTTAVFILPLFSECL